MAQLDVEAQTAIRNNDDAGLRSAAIRYTVIDLALPGEPGLRDQILDGMRQSIGNTNSGQVLIGFVKSWFYAGDNLVNGIVAIPSAVGALTNSVINQGPLQTFGNGVGALQKGLFNLTYGSGENRGALLFNIVTAPVQGEIVGSYVIKPVGAGASIMWDASSGIRQGTLDAVYPYFQQYAYKTGIVNYVVPPEFKTTSLIGGVEVSLELSTASAAEKTLFNNKFPLDAIDDPKIVPNQVLPNISGNFNYVVLEDGRLVVGKSAHTSLTNNTPVQAAGEIQLYNGSVKWIDNASGHYQPTGPAIANIVESAFNKIGIDATGKFQNKVWMSDPSLPRGGKWIVQ